MSKTYVSYENEDNTVDVFEYNEVGKITAGVFNLPKVLSESDRKSRLIKFQSSVHGQSLPSSEHITAHTDQSHLPKTKRRYYNPKTGKMVSYIRAKQLKLC